MCNGNKHCVIHTPVKIDKKEELRLLKECDFKIRSNLRHNNFYIYDKSYFTRSHDMIDIICPIHGLFSQRGDSHLQGCGCPKCAIVFTANLKKSQTAFIFKANMIFNHRFDYSVTEYVDSSTKIKIRCPIHDYIFEQYPSYHLMRYCGCKYCNNEIKLNSFVNESNIIHDYKYDYSLAEFINMESLVQIICPIHGIFYQKPTPHKAGKGCSKCAGRGLTLDERKLILNKVHNFKFDYSLFIYTKSEDKIKIICPIHGIYEQSYHSHMCGRGCDACGGSKSKTLEEIKKEFIDMHDDTYDYSLITEIINVHTDVDIICKEHGVFRQTSNNHKRGQGCPACKENKGERDIRNFLINNIIKLESQKIFDDCKNIRVLPFDFYLTDYNICIEFHGRQHYESVEYYGGEEEFKKRQMRDKIKMEYCENNNIPLLIIPYWEHKNIALLINESIVKVYKN